MLDWLQQSQNATAVGAVAAAVQAVTALAIVTLTVFLVVLTRAYARSAKDQVNELIRARLALVQPVVDVVECSIGGRVGPYLHGLEVAIEAQNLGAGPALSLRARLDHPRLNFSHQTQPVTIPPNEKRRVAFNSQSSTTDAGAPMEQSMQMRIEYRDVVGRWWATSVPLTLGYTRQGDGTYQAPSIAVEDQQTKFGPIERPTITGALAPSGVYVVPATS